MFSFRRNTNVPNSGSSSNQNIAILEKGLRDLCDGNFLVKFDLPKNDVMAPIAELLNQYSRNNASLLIKTSTIINETVAICLHEGEKLNKLAETFEVQTEQIEQVTFAVSQLAGSINDLAKSTNATSDSTISGKASMELADKSVQQAAAESTIAKTSINTLNAQVSDLHEATTRIDQLVSVVKSVSSQTNLLALNAAIEAARAGEYGRGFSVVAEEVRKLADQSNQSVEEITHTLTEIRNEVGEIKSRFQDMDISFQNNAEYINSASGNVKKLLEVFQNIGVAMQNLAPIAQEQSSTFEEMSATIETISRQTADVNITMQECNREIFNVLNSFNDIRSEISSLRLGFSPKEIIDLSKTDHLLWKARISYMLNGIVSLKAENVNDHSVCRLGKWYFGDGQAQFGHLSTFKNLDSVHKQFHLKCAEAIKSYQLGDISKAKKLSSEIDCLSERVLAMLDEIKFSSR